ncbi:hypothetical protein GNI_044280 [Gregarina niphandrodes]|uniref:Uncharacterized protein n=1 Tax=Gregarina niphandrodes TaxID=110365 RepID=A0A023B9X0_GRENI|nr:hypothetical protein GNI_044280 [Gregarina niphandrodes]EZG76622.1 hypothetical protein GNI_044280 [Gregarina niphandrodes]|eukprot:XP_011129560.1 hypothetical protein GNI_044280 [Gregarina niphandrodes]
MASVILRYYQLPILDIKLEAVRKRKILYIKKIATPDTNEKELLTSNITDRLSYYICYNTRITYAHHICSSHMLMVHMRIIYVTACMCVNDLIDDFRMDEIKRVTSIEPTSIVQNMMFINRLRQSEKSIDIIKGRRTDPAAIILKVEQSVQ